MLPRIVPLLLLALGCLAGPGCRTTPDGPSAQSEYRPPAQGVPAGFLKGTRRRVGFLADHHYGYVLLVDRKFVPDARKGWDKPLPLEPGQRMITAEYINGPFTARADIPLEVRPGVTYQLMILNGTEGPDGARFNDFWIVDAGGRVVSQVQHAPVSGGNSNYNPFSVY